MQEMRKANVSDLDAIVKLHMMAFPKYFLTHLGMGMVSRVYATYLSNSSNNVVCYKNGELVGFVIGNSPGRDLGTSFWRANFWRVTLAMAWALARGDGVVWHGLLDRLRRIKKALRAKFSRSCQKHASSSATRNLANSTAWLISIAVKEACKGSGVAVDMLKYFESSTRLLGGNEVMLCAYKNNPRALAFYRKMGYGQFSETKLLYMFRKHLEDDDRQKASKRIVE